MPEARFECWGPVTWVRKRTGQVCQRMHAELGLGEHFRFMGNDQRPARRHPGRRCGPDDEHLGGDAHGAAGGDGPGEAGGGDQRRRRAQR